MVNMYVVTVKKDNNIVAIIRMPHGTGWTDYIDTGYTVTISRDNDWPEWPEEDTRGIHGKNY
jgi:hypothetical protein